MQQLPTAQVVVDEGTNITVLGANWHCTKERNARINVSGFKHKTHADGLQMVDAVAKALSKAGGFQSKASMDVLSAEGETIADIPTIPLETADVPTTSVPSSTGKSLFATTV